jgi:CubicO group peptidase (beta-lactamase class C family)
MGARGALGFVVLCGLWSPPVRAQARDPLTRQPTLEGHPAAPVAALARILQSYRADSLGDLKGVVVQQHGRRVAEQYYNGDDVATLHDIRSATKSITALLVGIALGPRATQRVDTPLEVLLPGRLAPAQQAIRLRDLLTMRAGLDADDEDARALGNETRLDDSPDWMAFVRAVPMASAPGERYVYSSLTAFLAGRVVEQQAQQPLSDFANTVLFQPLGIRRFAWRRGPRGEGVGQGNLSLTVRDMVAIGELVLRHGRAGGRQVVDSAWVAHALAVSVSIGAVDRYADGYGYLWYTKTYALGARRVTVHFASGNGGNKIYVIPAYDAVVAISSSAYGRPYGQRRSEDIVRRVLAVLPPA